MVPLDNYRGSLCEQSIYALLLSLGVGSRLFSDRDDNHDQFADNSVWGQRSIALEYLYGDFQPLEW